MEEIAMWENVRNDARNELRLSILTDVIFNAARLNYSGKKLAFDDDEICTVLRVLFPDDYDGVLANLQALKAGEEKDGDAF
ncbi:MAG: hypothetical protein PUJ35_09860 [Ruminococcus bromii]|nr:hypothetical protein [Ruminococcus bromii]